MENRAIRINNDSLKAVIDTLLSGDFYNAGDAVEVAKGKHEYSKGLKVNFRKLKRKLKTL